MFSTDLRTANLSYKGKMLELEKEGLRMAWACANCLDGVLDLSSIIRKVRD